MYFKHGMSRSGHYDRWRHMMARCYDKDCIAYPDYGGRGIRVCAKWHDITAFVADLPDGYRKGLEIDRIDNDGDYEPGNVRWATRQENSTNRRSARLLASDGRTQSLTEWADETGISAPVLLDRLDKWGWPVDRALTEPVAERVENMRRVQSLRWAGHTKKPAPPPRITRRFAYQGADRTVNEIAALTEIDARLLRKRLCERGWTVEKATST